MATKKNKIKLFDVIKIGNVERSALHPIIETLLANFGGVAYEDKILKEDLYNVTDTLEHLYEKKANRRNIPKEALEQLQELSDALIKKDCAYVRIINHK